MFHDTIARYSITRNQPIINYHFKMEKCKKWRNYWLEFFFSSTYVACGFSEIFSYIVRYYELTPRYTTLYISFRFKTFSQEYYLSNCMFPPLASTSWTEMLMPLLLFANEMLLVTHEFDLKYNTNKVRSLSTSLQNITKRKQEKKKKLLLKNILTF